MPQQIGWSQEAKLLYQIKKLSSMGGGGGGGGLLIFPTLAGFPPAGDSAMIYLAEDTAYIYYWDGATYVQMGGGAPDGGLLQYPTSAGFPAVGTGNTIYLAQDTELIYSWNGSGYTQIAAVVATPGDKLFLFNYY